MIETVEFGGWPNCIRLSNGEIEVIATTDVGPRIIRLGFVGGPNLFHNFPATLGRTGDADWNSYGGHRLWAAPEVFPRTYAPDNTPVEHDWDGTTLTLRNSDSSAMLDKETRVTLSPTAPRIEISHRIINRNPWAVELAPWALSVMATGGRAIYPQEDYKPHPDCLVPARPLVLWHFTDMTDPRWTWGRKYIQLRQDPKATIKRYPCLPGAEYADMGCNTETYTDPDMLEVETLGPVARIEPGEHVDHAESWLVAKVECGPTDADIDAHILPLVDKLGPRA